jgi:hypothetical protein
LKVVNMQGSKPLDVFSINAVRTPVFMADVDIQSEHYILKRSTTGYRMGNPAYTGLLDSKKH